MTESRLGSEALNGQYTRRQVLAGTGKSLVALGVAGGLGSLLTACVSDDGGDDSGADSGDTDGETSAEDETSDPSDDSTPEDDSSDAGDGSEEDSSGSAEGDRYGGTLTYGTLGDVEYGSLDMTTTTGTYDLEVGRALNDAYVHLLPDESFVPGLAESWEISDDGLEYTFKLREDVVFHDGEPLDAEAVKYNFDRMTDEERNPNGISYSYLGAGATYGGCETVDEYTFRITQNEPNAIFMFRMRRKYMSPQSPKAVEEHGDQYFRNPVSVGPFKFVSWEEGSEVVYEANEEYAWGPPEIFENPERPYIDRIVYRIFRDLSTKASSLEAGELDVAARLSAEDFDRLQAGGEIETYVREQTGQSTFLYPNLEREPTSDIAVREAIGFAIDRQALSDSVYFGLYPPAYHVFTPSMWSYDESLEGLFGYDPERAGTILDEAGWTMGDNGVRERDGEPLQLHWVLDEESLPVGQFIQAQLREIGVGVELETLAGSALLEAELGGEHHIAGGTGGWIQEDPDVLRAWAHSSLIDVRQNFARINDPELDALLEEGLNFVGDYRSPEREEIYREAQRIIMENFYVIPLYYRRSFEAHQPNVHISPDNIGYDPYGTYHEWNDVWLED